MNANHSYLRITGLVAAVVLGLPGLRASEPTKSTKDTDAFPNFDNHITVSGLATDLSGAKSAYQARTQVSKKGAGGIEELAYNYDLSKETNLEVDGRALPGAEDYLAQFKVTKNEVGSFEAGYKRFRTFYDGMGGFFPLNNAWLPLYPRALFVDRGKFFVDGSIALPKMPVFTLSYTNETRSGRKDSTIWGDTDQTGVPIYSLSSLNLVSANRKIVPAYIQLGERQQKLEASVRHTMGNTTGVFTVLLNRIDNLDTRSIDRYPGELKPFPAIPSSPVVLVPALLANNQNKGFDQRGFKENGVTFSGKIETVINAKVTAFISGSYRHANEDIADARLISALVPTLVGTQSAVGAWTSGGRPPYSYTSTGGMKMEIWTGNIGVETKPMSTLRVDAGLRLEDFRSSGDTTATYINNLVNQTTGAVTFQPLVAPNSSRIKEKPVTPEVDVRYIGIRNVTLFGTWDYRSAPGDERTSYIGVSPSGSVILPGPGGATDNVKEKHANFTVGANWITSSFLTLRGEFFSKDHENNFKGYGTGLGSYYTLDYDIYGARMSAILRVRPGLSLNTRYVVQRGKAEISEDGFLDGDSNDSRRYHIAETIDWAPSKILYVQGSVNLVYDKTSTAYPRAGGSANDVLHNADNNYWDGSLVAGFVIDKFTDAQVLGTYYRANNYNRALAAATDPYGAGVRDYSIAVGLKHKFNDRMIGSGRLGYLNSNNDTTGGFANYKGLVGYLSLSYRL